MLRPAQVNSQVHDQKLEIALLFVRLKPEISSMADIVTNCATSSMEAVIVCIAYVHKICRKQLQNTYLNSI